MHLVSSYTTGPAAVFWNAPTGQAETQLGTLQCMHIFLAKRGPRRLTTENVLSERVSDRTSSDVRGSLLRSLQAREQAPHPMQRVVSRRIPFFPLVVIMTLALLPRSGTRHSAAAASRGVRNSRPKVAQASSSR